MNSTPAQEEAPAKVGDRGFPTKGVAAGNDHLIHHNTRGYHTQRDAAASDRERASSLYDHVTAGRAAERRGVVGRAAGDRERYRYHSDKHKRHFHRLFPYGKSIQVNF